MEVKCKSGKSISVADTLSYVRPSKELDGIMLLISSSHETPDQFPASHESMEQFQIESSKDPVLFQLK